MRLPHSPSARVSTHATHSPYVRIETMRGVGLFDAALDFHYAIKSGRQWISRMDRREFENLYYALAHRTPAPDFSYRDTRSRYPRTWFKTTAGELLTIALRLMRLMNKYRSNLRPVYCENPGPILYEDALQVVVRPHRHPAPVWPARQGRNRRKRRLWTGDRKTIRRSAATLA